MAILYVDTEHPRVLHDAVSGPSHRARLDAALDRLAAAAGEPCQRLAFPDAFPARIARMAPTAVVIGGNTTDWSEFAPGTLDGLLATVRAAPVPILGVCAGHQLIGFAHGAAWGPLGPLREGEVDPDPRFAPGQRKARGFLPVGLDPRCRLFAGLAPTAVFFQSHYWQLAEVPRGFVGRATSPWSPIQAIERVDRTVFGVQFHPERDDADHANGAVVLRNFFALVGDAGANDPAARRTSADADAAHGGRSGSAEPGRPDSDERW